MLIGLHGKKQAGKDTVFERATKLMADVVTVERASFADLLYESAAKSLGVTVDDLRAWKSDPAFAVAVVGISTEFHELAPEGIYPIAGLEPLTIREYLQRYGTEAHRDVFGDDFWVEQLELAHEGRILMVTDVRFENEAAHVRRCGGYVVHVIGPEDVEQSGDGHASEKPLPRELVDDVLANVVRDDGFRSLDTEVNHLLRRLLKRTLS